MDSLFNWTLLTATLGYLLTLLLIRWVLLLKKREPVATVAWIMAIITMPLVGGLLFLFFGINRIERHAVGKQRARKNIGRNLPEWSQYQLTPGALQNPGQDRLDHFTQRVAGTLPTSGNQIELLTDTNRTLGLIRQAIGAAQHSVHLEYYIWQPDRSGTHLRDLLIEKAREGVSVRFLYDSLGSMHLTKRFLKPMQDAGIQVAAFLPGSTLRERWSLNLRNHRKLVVVDGEIGFTGGMNIGDEYLGRNPLLGYWRDTHLKITGPVVLQLQQVFAEDWYYARGEELTQPEFFPQPKETGHVAAQAIAGEPGGGVRVFYSLMFAAINEARQRVTLTTGYFVPPVSLLTALETAAYRGVRVRLLVPGRAAYRWTVLAGRSYYDSLLAAGVEIYEYEHGLLHCKTLTIDGLWSLVGTPNFDFRSLMLNFELAVAMYDDRIAEQLEAQFEIDVARSAKIDRDQWFARPVRHRLAENTCRLFAPVL